MKKLTRNQWVAVVLALVVVAAFFMTGSVLSFFGGQGSAIDEQTNSQTNSQSNINLNTSQNMDSFSSSVAGFEIQDIVVGTGAEASTGKIITVNYSGAFTDGRVFDSSYNRGEPIEFTLGSGMVIQGWEKGFDGMKVGGKRRLIIPSAYGYGPAGRGMIPPNTDLVFEVELLGVR